MPPNETHDRKHKQDMDKLRSLALLAVVKAAPDLEARTIVETYVGDLDFSIARRHELMIEEDAWSYVAGMGYKASHVFCHPDLLKAHPSVSLYYRGMTGLSRKSVGQLASSVDRAENDSAYRFRRDASVVSICQLYNLFISSIIKGSQAWALENGYRTILATMGITFDGSSRNKVGDIAENLIRKNLLDFLIEKGLLAEDVDPDSQNFKPAYLLSGNEQMKFSKEPDVYFTNSVGEAICTIEIKGGTDPAGALERLGAAQKSFLHAIRATANCKTYLIAGVVTKTMEARLLTDRNFTQHFAMVDILTQPEARANFLREIFHYGLRLID